MNDTMLSIIIPYYKIDFFEDTLKSLSLQTDKRFNVFIGNDGSPDDPSALIEKYQNHFDLEYHKFDENLGKYSLIKQWERCIDLVPDTTWIQIIGDDDILEPTCVEAFYENLDEINRSGSQVVRYATRVIDVSSDFLTDSFTHPKTETSINFFIRKLNGLTRSSLPEYVFKFESFKAVGLRDFPLAWHSDDILVLEVSDFGNIYTINEANVLFRSSGINISSKQDNNGPKAYASFAYYNHLISLYSNRFDKNQLNLLLDNWERAFYNIKSVPKFWIQFSSYYLSHGLVLRYTNFIGRSLKRTILHKLKNRSKK
ncbi:glycosyltransferase family 2 protein [Nonlabens ponticola]|uniref:Glycosyltransferase n=1 Tax=Nonlabens ponticola TaxID=2496866 RepID=A0A3S9MXK8_9FLAO|nr:glycosyltransferase [Nonlabens ponticola]AZQ43869.1 glycosyltransferase [Nonlabens ponticola]